MPRWIKLIYIWVLKYGHSIDELVVLHDEYDTIYLGLIEMSEYSLYYSGSLNNYIKEKIKAKNDS